MNEVPSFIQEPDGVSKNRPAPTHILPPYREQLFRDRVAVLKISDEDKDVINFWWRTIDITADRIQRCTSAINIDGLPREEKRDVRTLLGNTGEEFQQINQSFNSLLQKEIGPIRQTIRLYLSVISEPKEELAAEAIAERMSNLIKRENQPSVDQAVAFCEAFAETKGLNDEHTMRIKIAQWGFEEMINLFPRYKIWYQHNVGVEPTTVDALENEKSELIAALRGDLWTPKETRKWSSFFNKNRESMDKFQLETDVKRGFDFILKCATGQASPNHSAISILRKVENVWQGIKDDDTLKRSWDYELEKEKN